MRSSVFDQMASLVTVRCLQTQLGPELRADQTTAEAWSLLMEDTPEGYDPTSSISLVVEKGEPIGWLALDMLDSDATVGACADPIQPGSVLSADTTGLEAAQLFGTPTSHFYFVLDHTRITGTLHYEDLFRLPFSLCMFALVLQLEDSALRLVEVSPTESWGALPAGRRQKAETVYEARHGHAPDPTRLPFAELLECTTFCDKGTIIRKQSLLPDVDRKTLKAIFGRAERVRNACAHTGQNETSVSLAVKRTDLVQLIRDIRELVEKIEAACHVRS